MSNIFKFYINNNNIYSKLFIFINDYNDSDIVKINNKMKINNLSFFEDEIFTMNLNKYFTESEIELIKKYNTAIILINDFISSDDTIETVKLKLINAFINNDIDNISFEEIYFYGISHYKFDSYDFYNKCTNNGKENLSYDYLINYIINFNNNLDIIKKITKKETYSYNDILSLNLEDVYIDIPIANKINDKKNKYLNIVNPFNIHNNNVYLKSLLHNNISTCNSDLLFEYNIINNTIYVVLLSDIIKSKSIKS